MDPDSPLFHESYKGKSWQDKSGSARVPAGKGLVPRAGLSHADKRFGLDDEYVTQAYLWIQVTNSTM